MGSDPSAFCTKCMTAGHKAIECSETRIAGRRASAAAAAAASMATTTAEAAAAPQSVTGAYRVLPSGLTDVPGDYLIDDDDDDDDGYDIEEIDVAAAAAAPRPPGFYFVRVPEAGLVGPHTRSIQDIFPCTSAFCSGGGGGWVVVVNRVLALRIHRLMAALLACLPVQAMEAWSRAS